MKRGTIVKALLFLCMTAVMGSVQVKAKEDTWAIYLYLCGSDLESEGGAATEDIMELLDVELPENVTVVIETGGASEWQNEVVEADYLERYVYDAEDFTCVEQVELANMGESDTLADFLDFCSSNYPADHEMVIFWNHGGGSTQGVAFDELFDYDSLTLDEMYDAFDSVYDLSEGAPFDIVGFDTCLMATIDTANTFSSIADYMVASEETEPGCGWYYTGWLSFLAENPSADAEELGRSICDTYVEGCEMIGEEDEITLSVTDLQKVQQLLEVYEELGKEAISNQSENAYFYTEFCRNTENAESYGGNTESAGYTNMVDLGDLVRQNEDIFPLYAQDVLTALNDCIVYKVNGDYRQEATGLSCYYSFNNDEEDLESYSSISASDSFASFYNYCLLDYVTPEMEAYFDTSDIDIADMQTVETFGTYQDEQLEDDEEIEIPVEIDEDGYAMIQLDEELMNVVQGIYFNLAYVDEEEDLIMWLGTDNNIEMDWDNGIFRDNFDGYWGCLNGNLCYREIAFEGEDYNLYYVPILLNGEKYQLHVVYDYNSEEYHVLGARKGLDDNGMADRNLVQLKEGDKITTLFYASSYSDDEEEEELFEFDEFVLDGEPEFTDEDMGDGTYAMMFYMEDCRGKELSSEPIWFEVEDGEITADIA